MITPYFKITQDDDFLILYIEAPHAKISETELEYGDSTVCFSGPPYYLRLHLPGEVIQDDRSKGSYDSDKGAYTFHIPKLHSKEEFKGLDFISNLLSPQVILPSSRKLVEECDEEDNSEEENEGDEYLIEQKEVEKEELICDEKALLYGYGFAWRRLHVLGKLKDEIGKIFELEDPENSLIDERNNEIYKKDCIAFNPQHYLADTYDMDDNLLSIINWKSPSYSIIKDDIERLKDLPKKKLPVLSKEENGWISMSLIDILFSFAYNERINEGEKCIESSWNYIKLSPSLFAFVRWKNEKEAMYGCIRRSLIYPLYRCITLAEKVFEDTKEIFKSGRSSILHCLCVIHEEMACGGEFRYLLNDLLINELIIWIQSVDEDIIQKIYEELKDIKIDKESIGLNLMEFETSAEMEMLRINKDDNEETDSDDE